jgi:molecular chaperone DnaK
MAPSDRPPRSIGIDLGTSNSCVASLDAAGQPRIITNRQGARTLPSVVGFAPGGKLLVGAPAKRQMLSAPRDTVFAVKRLIGRRWDDPEIRKLARTLPYAVVPAENGDAWVEVNGQRHSPQEISAHVLEAVRHVAEEQLAGGGSIDEAIITVPAHFDAAQRQATKDAAEIAGLRVRRLLNEPTAAALGHGVHRGAPARVAVCDLGGGTFDVSILNAEGGVFEVIATHGDILLGGEDFDRRIIERLAAEIRERHGLDVLGDATLLGRVRDEAERVKHVLSEAADARVEIPYLTMVDGKQVDFVRPLTRAELEGWVKDVVDRLEAPCRAALEQAGLTGKDVEQVLLVGGMTRMPAVARKLEQVFGRKPHKGANPDEVVAIGAATQCAILDGVLGGVVLLDVTSRAIGVHAGGGRFAPVIPKNATVPTRESRIIPTVADGQRELVVEVYEGESADVRQNRPLGVFTLSGLPDGPAGEVVAMVDFTVDVDGILSVSARELSSGARADVRLAPACGLSRRDVRKLVAARPR